METDRKIITRDIIPASRGGYFSLSTSETEPFEDARQALSSKISELTYIKKANSLLAAAGFPLALSGLGLMLSAIPSKSTERLVGGSFLFSVGIHFIRSLDSGMKRSTVVSQQISVIKEFIG